MPTTDVPTGRRMRPDDPLAQAVRVAYDGAARTFAPQIKELRDGQDELRSELEVARKALDDAAEEYREGSADLVVRAVERVRREVAAETAAKLESFFAEIRGQLAQFSDELKALEGRADGKLSGHADETGRRVGEVLAAVEDRADETERRLEAKLESVRAAYESALGGLIEAVRAIPQPQVVNQLPEMAPQINLPEMRVENRVEVSPTPIENRVEVNPTPVTVENTVTPAPVENVVQVNPTPVSVAAPEVLVEVNPTPVTVEARLETPGVTVETPPMEKTFEYDNMGRPVRVVERKIELKKEKPDVGHRGK